MHNVPKLMSGKPRCTLKLHASDAKRLGIEDGQSIELTSRVGSITVPADVGQEVMPGVVCLPHGFGHNRAGIRLDVAAQHAGPCNGRRPRAVSISGAWGKTKTRRRS
jgi:anaerobic selenocysteine-containing dehydrogenase